MKHLRLICLLVWSSLLLVPLVVNAFEAGDSAPDFRLPDIDGKEHALSDFKGRAVVLKLATTWCPTCKQLSGDIENIGPYLKEKGVVFLEVFVQDKPAMIQRFLEGRDYVVEFYPLLDDGSAHKAYSVYHIPRLLVIDPEQKVAYDNLGQNVSLNRIRKLADKYAVSPPVETPAE